MAKKRNNQPSFSTPVNIATFNPAAAAAAAAPPPQAFLDAVAATAAAPAPSNFTPTDPYQQNILNEIAKNPIEYVRDNPPAYPGLDMGIVTVPEGYSNAGQQFNYSPGKTAADDPPYTPKQPVRPAYDRGPAKGILANLLRQFGLESMLGEIESFIEDFGANDEFSLAERIRGSQGYKDRFKGLVNLRNKGITDIQNEADYLRLETEYRQAFRDAGIQSYLGEAGSVAERDAIADLAGKYSVSVNEVRSRINDAQRVVQRTDPNTIDALRRFYNIAPSDLVAYTLDPTRTSSRINQLANAAIVGGMAADAGLQVGRGAAEQFSSLMGDNDLSADYTLNQLGRAREVRDSTARLASIEESTLSDDETLLAEANLDQEAKRRIRGLQSRERARFGGAGAFRTGSLTTPTT